MLPEKAGRFVVCFFLSVYYKQLCRLPLNTWKVAREMQRLNNNVAIIILAAGLGKRMKSKKAKVLHKILNRPMIMYVVETATKIAGNDVIVVVGHQAQKVIDVVSKQTQVHFALQDSQLGTGHATLCALPFIPEYVEEVIILCGDVPVLSPITVQRLLDDHLSAKRDLSLLAVSVDNPKGYGRILVNENRHLLKIIEEADATEEQKMIKTVNAGIYCVNKNFLIEALQQLQPNNAQGELYLTDIAEIGYKKNKAIGVVFCDDSKEVIGVNNNQDLIAAEVVMRSRLTKTS
jgi:UDP-N-acetylglucosamine diphosphorylase/glucosamine-1-phosphate N-acetyltransferase